MVGFAGKADAFKRKLIKTLGRGSVEDSAIFPAFENAKCMAMLASADFIEKRAVPYRSDNKLHAAEVLFVRFGQGAEVAWVAFAVFASDQGDDDKDHIGGGWMNAFRPLTEDTVTMPWLDTFVTEKLVG